MVVVGVVEEDPELMVAMTLEERKKLAL